MRKLVLLIGVLTAAMTTSTTAFAAPRALPTVQRTLEAGSAIERDCLVRRDRAARWVDTTTYRARMSGFVTVRLVGSRRGDWDLALFDKRTGRKVGSSAAFGSREVAQTWIGSGDRLLVQACRRSGSQRQVQTTIDFLDIAPPTLDGSPSLLRVAYESQADLQRLERLGVDVTHHIHDGRADVIVPESRFLDLLDRAGFEFDVEIADLARHFSRARAADAQYTARVARSGLPSGRTNYRLYEDYQMELKQLVEENPGLVKPVVLPKRTLQGREIQGVEIGVDVRQPEDGRPVFFLMGLHHAREWPSAETVMEFAHHLVQGYGSDEHITDLLGRSRVVVVPVINPDGFVSSRGAVDPADLITNQGAGNPLGQGIPDGGLLTLAEAIAPPGGILAYRRKNCNGLVPSGDVPCELQWGVDPNRNYGYNWGGSGSSGEVFSQSYRGTGPWSELETQAVHEFSQGRQITNLVTVHNVAALVLRPPGVAEEGLAPDEEALKEIGDKMAEATGYTSQYGFQLYDTSGTTEDWNYAQQATFGYTIEMGPVNGEFHMPYETGVVREWEGHSGREGRGLREAYMTAWEAAVDERHHSVLEGRAPAGRVLRAKKSFVTKTKPTCRTEVGLSPLNSEVLYDTVAAATGERPCLDPLDSIEVPDGLDTTMTVPASGRFEWHVTPSTRPFVLRPPGTTAPVLREETIGEGSGLPASPPPTFGAHEELETSEEFEFDVDTSDGAKTLEVELVWPLSAEDYDLYVWKLEGEERVPVGEAASTAYPEVVTVADVTPGRYVARVANWAGLTNGWTLTVREYGTGAVQPGSREAWTITCESPDAQTVYATTEVIVDRGQRVTIDPCRTGTTPAPPGGNGSPPPDFGGGVPPQPPSEPKGPPEDRSRSERPPADQRNADERKAKRRAAKRKACIRKAKRRAGRKARRRAVRRCNRRHGRATRPNRRAET